MASPIDYSLFKGYALVIYNKKGVKNNSAYSRMICTTNMELIPKDQWPINPPLPWDDTVRVFDVETSAWRSFKKSNFIGMMKIERQD